MMVSDDEPTDEVIEALTGFLTPGAATHYRRLVEAAAPQPAPDDAAIVAELLDLGLVGRVDSDDVVFAYPPNVTLPRLFADRASAWLESVPHLLSIATATQRLAPIATPTGTTDVSVDGDHDRQATVESLVVSAKQEISVMQPYYEWAPDSGFSEDEWTSTADTVTAPDVVCRYVYDDRLFNVPGFLDVIVREVELGAEVRLTDRALPGFLFIVDRRAAAFTPQSRGVGQLTTADIHVGLLSMAFEHAWTRAVAFQQDESLTPQLWAVLTLVGVGHNNKEIASKLGVSNRTIRRRVDQLCAIINAPDRSALIRHALLMTSDANTP